jgi:arylsulfatase A-like enzyme/Flp pilus assembly protein TadD
MKRRTKRRAQPAARGAQPGWKRSWITSVLVFLAASGAAAAFFLMHGGPVGGLGRVHIDPKLAIETSFPGGAGDLAGCNLLLVTLDTTRADYLGCYGGQVHTPTLDGLARRGVLFSQAITPAPITLPAHASLLTGLYPHHHGARTNAFYRLDDRPDTLAGALKKAGYTTGAVISAFVLDSRFGLDRDFDNYNDDLSDATPHPEQLEPERKADRTTDHAIAWLRENSAHPFFLWVHYYDPHAPFDPPPPYAQQYAQNPYGGEIAFMDAEFGRLLQTLQQLGLTDKTLIVAAADHGESLGEHGEGAHGYLLYDATVHVPLIMACGQRLGGGVHVPGLVSLTDVMPTALSLLGVPAPPTDGRDLTTFEPAGPVYCESLYSLVEQGWAALFAVFDGQKKYIFTPHPQLFDLAADPHENRNLLASQPEIAARMLNQVSEFYGDELTRPGAPEATETLDALDVAKLQSLGYAGARTPDDFGNGPRPDPAELLPLLEKMQQAISGAIGGYIPYQQAAQVIQDVINSRPDFYPAYQYLADLLNDTGNLEQAAAVARHGLELRPKNVGLLLSLARIETQQGQNAEAAALFRRVLENYPESFDAQIGLGAALLMSGQSADAVDVFIKLAAVAPEDTDTCGGLVRAAIASHRTDDAAQALATVVEQRPTLVAPRVALAAIQRTQKLCAQATRLLREGLELAPGQPKLTDALAATLLEAEGQLHDPDEAARLMESLCQRTQYKQPEFMLTLSAAYHQLGRQADAISLARSAQQLAARNGQTDLAQRIAGALQRYQQAGG